LEATHIAWTQAAGFAVVPMSERRLGEAPRDIEMSLAVAVLPSDADQPAPPAP
jgi:hypothetical protein